MLLKIYLNFDNLKRQDEYLNVLPPFVRSCLGAACHRPIFKMCIVIIRSYQSMHTCVYFYYKFVPLVYPYFLRPHTNSKINTLLCLLLGIQKIKIKDF